MRSYLHATNCMFGKKLHVSCLVITTPLAWELRILIIYHLELKKNFQPILDIFRINVYTNANRFLET